MVDFTYDGYFDNLKLLRKNGYSIALYADAKPQKCAILRHDVDFSLKSAVEFAEREAASGDDIKSTYFVLLRTDFYNPFSAESQRQIRRIQELGHEIGLHFDEMSYGFEGDLDRIRSAVISEKSILEQITGRSVHTVSMHRPSRLVLNADLKFDGMINSYSQEYFKQWKYVSDSRMNWREDLSVVIKSGNYDRLHILTHAFWYSDKLETTREKLFQFVTAANIERYTVLDNNFRDLPEFLRREEIT